MKDFQCVTGWRVPDVHWEGVRSLALLDTVGVKPERGGAHASSPTTVPTPRASPSTRRASRRHRRLPHARRPDHDRARRTRSALRGADVRLQVAQVALGDPRVDQVEPGFWEQNGYPVNGWIDGSTGPTDPELPDAAIAMTADRTSRALGFCRFDRGAAHRPLGERCAVRHPHGYGLPALLRFFFGVVVPRHLIAEIHLWRGLRYRYRSSSRCSVRGASRCVATFAASTFGRGPRSAG